MPAPLATPKILAVDSPEEKLALANLGRVSVVMMARAKSAIPRLVALRPAVSSGSLETIFLTGSGTPIIPVEDGKISLARSFRSVASPAQTSWQLLIPTVPVAQLALPEFTITARMRPRVEANAARPISRGAATTRFFVNTAAALVPAQASTRARSGLPLALIPALADEKLKPAGRHIVFWGRPGSFIPRSSPANW